jgi:DNA-binding LacI/PurR family transcriptional regulator
MARATLDSVAERARVSRQTVSNVLNAPDRVRPATAERVRAAILELGYRPSVAARQLATGRSRVLGLGVPPASGAVRDGVGDAFLHALTEAAESHGYRIMLFSAADDAAEIAQYAELLEGADLDGFVLANTHHGDPRTRWLAERGVPFVTFGRPWGEPDATHPWVDVDGAAGTAAATTHLHGLGHTRIGFVGWPAGSGVGDDRRTGWRSTLARLVPGTDPEMLRTEILESSAEAAGTIAALLREQRPTALVCVSDFAAVAATDAARETGSDIAVVGFDDSVVAHVLGLSSLRQPLAAAAARCLDLVLGQDRTARVLLPPDLVLRPSTDPSDDARPVSRTP